MRVSWLCVTAVKVIVLTAIVVPGTVRVSQAQASAGRRVIQVSVDGSYLGVEMEDVTADNMATYKLSAERGVIVRSVVKGSPAEAAGLQENDVILECAGMTVLSAAQFARTVRETPIGRKVDLLISREGKKLTISAKIGKRDDGEWSSGDVEIQPREGRGRGFFMPGPHSFNFRIPDGEWDHFTAPEGGRLAFSREKPRLGVTLQPLTDQLAEFLGVTGKKGAMVTAVTDGSPAAGKLKAGDVIIRADDRSIGGPEDLVRSVSGREGKLSLTIVREKKEMSVTVELPKSESGSSKGGYRL